MINSIINLIGIFMLAGLVIYCRIRKDMVGVVAWGFILIAYILIIKNVI